MDALLSELRSWLATPANFHDLSIHVVDEVNSSLKFKFRTLFFMFLLHCAHKSLAILKAPIYYYLYTYGLCVLCVFK